MATELELKLMTTLKQIDAILNEEPNTNLGRDCSIRRIHALIDDSLKNALRAHDRDAFELVNRPKALAIEQPSEQR